jgi:hypothetical protein
MDMKITKLCKYLMEKWFHHTKHNHVDEETKLLIYQAREEKMQGMSKRSFGRYIEKYGIWRWTLRNIISDGDWIKMKWKDPLWQESRENKKKETYTERYHHTSRTKKVDMMTEDEKSYIINFRNNNPNAWYKRFYNKHLQPKACGEYGNIFGGDDIINKEMYYATINEAWLKKRLTKRGKRTWIKEQYKEAGGIKAYCNKMRYVYMNEKAMHRRQVDIKYLIDIPNMLKSEIAFIYPYQITFRDFKSWAVILFFGRNRDTSRVMVATQVFGVILQQLWIDLKNVLLQFDGWAEFGTIRINWSEGKYLEYVNKNFKWYKLIERKEHNGHVEAYHRICEEDFMDTEEVIADMKRKTREEKKIMFIDRTHEYVKNHNKYWFSSYRPRYETFWKKSPQQIIIDDWGDRINHHILETYFGAYDVDWWIKLPQKNTYKTLINAIINNNRDVTK